MQEKNSTKQEESQLICPLLAGQLDRWICRRDTCAMWDKLYRECGILSISEELGKIVDVLIDRRK